MKKNVLLILITLTSSLHSQESKLDNDLEMLYILNDDINYQIIQITDNINDKVYNHKELITQKFKQYDSLTTLYIKFIDEILKKITPLADGFKPSVLRSTKTNNAYFFKDNDYTLEGKEYLNKTDEYRETVTSLSENYFTRSRLQLTLNTKPINLANGEIMNHLDYYLKNRTLLGVIVYLKNHKRKVLEYENYFLYDCIIDQSKSE